MLDNEVGVTPHNWALLKEIYVLLKPLLKTAQELLEGNKYVSISWLPLMVGTLWELLKETLEPALEMLLMLLPGICQRLYMRTSA